MAKSRREEPPRPPAGARPLLDRRVAPEPGHVVGRAAGRGRGDLGPVQTHGDPDAVPIPAGIRPRNLGASREPRRAAAGRSAGRRVGSATPARRGRGERCSGRTRALAAAWGCAAAGARRAAAAPRYLGEGGGRGSLLSRETR